MSKNTLSVNFIGPDSDHIQNLFSVFEKIEKKGKKEQLIQILQILDKDLEDITMVSEDYPSIYAKRHEKLLRPIFIMGHGFCKLMDIACTLIDSKNSVLLVDEIENGFDHDILFDLWKIMEKLSIENNIQIFTTTNSYECIEFASDAINKDNIMYVRIGKSKNYIKQYIFDGDNFLFCIENNMEIR
ncbi:AAA family ATPase [Desulfovibrio sp. An276]|uniref:AAA family ATPase n=1 Tax=Desulfovibrio sp. An276 TaxID=1965618 RepID=UPI0013A6085D|nr:AAA family ATPase [Desulfovibrio sp. An276]